MMAESASPQTVLLNNLRVVVPDLKNLSPGIRQIDKTATAVVDQLPSVMLNASIGLLIIILGWMFSTWLATWLNRVLNRLRLEETLAAFIASTMRFTVFFTIFITGLTIIGVKSTSIAAILGAIGLAVGIAMRGTLANASGGLLLIAHRPFKVGDFIENMAGGVMVSGTVKRIGLFSTEINTLDFVRVFVPNSALWENALKNHSYNRMHMSDGVFMLGYKADARAAFKVIKEALNRHPLVLKTPEPLLAVTSMDEKGVICKAEVWSRSEDRKTLKDEMMLVVLEALQAHEVDVPAPVSAAPLKGVEVPVAQVIASDESKAPAREATPAADGGKVGPAIKKGTK